MRFFAADMLLRIIKLLFRTSIGFGLSLLRKVSAPSNILV